MLHIFYYIQFVLERMSVFNRKIVESLIKTHGKFIYKFGSGVLPGKMLLVRIVENKKSMIILGQDRLSKG